MVSGSVYSTIVATSLHTSGSCHSIGTSETTECYNCSRYVMSNFRGSRLTSLMFILHLSHYTYRSLPTVSCHLGDVTLDIPPASFHKEVMMTIWLHHSGLISTYPVGLESSDMRFTQVSAQAVILLMSAISSTRRQALILLEGGCCSLNGKMCHDIVD